VVVLAPGADVAAAAAAGAVPAGALADPTGDVASVDGWPAVRALIDDGAAAAGLPAPDGGGVRAGRTR
jgi:hypothetical protein